MSNNEELNTAIGGDKEFDTETAKVFQLSRLLNKYYEKVGKAAAGIGACPKFTEFRAGFGLVDETDPDNPQLLQIPPDMTEIPREFYRGLVSAEYSNGTTLCKCEIPQGAVSDAKRYSLTGIYDQDSDLVAVCLTLPDWVTPNEMYRSYPSLSFPMEYKE